MYTNRWLNWIFLCYSDDDNDNNHKQFILLEVLFCCVFAQTQFPADFEVSTHEYKWQIKKRLGELELKCWLVWLVRQCICGAIINNKEIISELKWYVRTHARTNKTKIKHMIANGLFDIVKCCCLFSTAYRLMF